MIFFHFSAIVNNRLIRLSREEHCCLHFGDKWVELPNDICSLSIGKEHIILACTDKTHSLSSPDNLLVFNSEGKIVWNLGDIINSNSLCERWFSLVVAHTKETLTQPPWSAIFGCVTLDDTHEYITAYDGGEQWLFDITDRSLVKRVFTH